MADQRDSPRILIIEDKVEELALLLEMLRTEHFDIGVAFHGMQGYKRAVARRPDLILLDVQLGSDMDGFAVCRLLKADPALAHVPVLFLTASNGLDERLTGLNEGAVDYISKPFAAAEVIARIHIHLRLASPKLEFGEYRALRASNVESDFVLVEAASRFLARHLADIPSLSEIARSVGTHEKRLTKAFREQRGVSVFEYVREERLQLAQQLLTETSLSVMDIAVETGFSSAANLATAFRARFSQSPSEFRSVQAAVPRRIHCQ